MSASMRISQQLKDRLLPSLVGRAVLRTAWVSATGRLLPRLMLSLDGSRYVRALFRFERAADGAFRLHVSAVEVGDGLLG